MSRKMKDCSENFLQNLIESASQFENLGAKVDMDLKKIPEALNDISVIRESPHRYLRASKYLWRDTHG